jgi:Fur family zinc uptake transcriptional regulator
MADGNILAPFQTSNHDHSKCIDDAIAAAETRCARDGRSFTALRRQVLELVWSSHRALEFLLACGLIHRIESLNAYVGCGSPDVHHGGQFLICRDCGAVAELDDPAISRAIAKKASALGFHMEQQTIEVTGLCPRCTAAAGKEN